MSERADTPSALPALRLAASLVVLRERASGLEVLLLRRAVRANDFSSDAYVFPGGVLDANDRAAHAVCLGMDDATASERLGLLGAGLDYYVAAMRECFEETGVFFASDEHGAPLDAARLAEVRARREALHDRQIDIASLCRSFGIRLTPRRLHYLSHWVTPLGLAKRFDTRFFLAALPEAQQVEVDHVETAAHRWMRPQYALAHADQLRLLPPTRKLLQWLTGMDTVELAMAAAGALVDVPRVQPRLANGRRGRWPITPDEPAWAELTLTDPDERGGGSYDIVPGRVVTLMPGVLRLTAPNPGMMTGPGTNTYLVGGGPQNGWAVIDPGPDDPAHIDAIVRAAPGEIRQILVTHTHRDHSPGAALLRARTGARTYGMAARHDVGQDTAFSPDVELADGDTVVLPDGRVLRAIHTPGHASNHLCYALEDARLVFTGDHVMQGSTVVINPPDGHMATYLASLQRLASLEPEWLAPGHGFVMDRPAQRIGQLITHRLAREARTLDALGQLGPATLDALTPAVYADVPAARHAVARRSLRAHLDKLVEDGRAAVSQDGRWRAVDVSATR
ncbi:MBL fold metallo-hydrolase [Pandoraea nosoerga]|uniref:NUDIX hydrolase n=1 Tax=Pandoraea nosoerga TaxID=2508296 RepID=A0A5E4X5I8_9BURK|nr:MBL fold metallo-hydrolase [Pandoraea nosoerga]MBN4665114.1 MBL fold metallo-hydrolase [Pandoraea nosoerga]MBN4675170.1 MBL fold metallo-hydrolase [Pandoraea nosoerga]MBN4680857.1 MBL fold metallo-hydrolase [Pandoraea nosoerga]MBN4744859.1 MBL fold metallo-hydrolase [Pandoraea nosoerga]VVE31563.1 NUDIX hydrolase [Pandoraea nosoerga]